MCYEPLVVPGGILAFHESVPYPQHLHWRAVHVFVEWAVTALLRLRG